MSSRLAVFHQLQDHLRLNALMMSNSDEVSMNAALKSGIDGFRGRLGEEKMSESAMIILSLGFVGSKPFNDNSQ